MEIKVVNNPAFKSATKESKRTKHEYERPIEVIGFQFSYDCSSYDCKKNDEKNGAANGSIHFK